MSFLTCPWIWLVAALLVLFGGRFCRHTQGALRRTQNIVFEFSIGVLIAAILAFFASGPWADLLMILSGLFQSGNWA